MILAGLIVLMMLSPIAAWLALAELDIHYATGWPKYMKWLYALLLPFALIATLAAVGIEKAIIAYKKITLSKEDYQTWYFSTTRSNGLKCTDSNRP